MNDYRLCFVVSSVFFLFLGLSRVRDKPKNVCVERLQLNELEVTKNKSHYVWFCSIALKF